MIFKKIPALILSAVLVFSFASCSGGGEKKQNKVKKDETAINKQYDEIMKEISSDGQKVYEDLRFNEQAFSSFDYSLYPPSDESAVFSLEKNSFGKVNLGGTYFNSVAPGNETQFITEQYKTAKGLGVLSYATDFIKAYNIEDGKAVYKPADSGVYSVLQNGTFTGQLTAVYASGDNGEFELLDKEETMKFVELRDKNAEGMYFDPKLVNDEFSQYKSVAVLDLCVNDIGEIWEFSICRFEEVGASEFTH